MAIKKTEKIWHNGKLIPWDEAQIHVMAHVVNYGSSVFEGVRCYAQPNGPAIFRAREHALRLLQSAKIYRIECPFTADELVEGFVEIGSELHELAAHQDGSHPEWLRRGHCARHQRLRERGIRGKPVHRASWKTGDAAVGELGAAGHHARQRAAPGERDEDTHRGD